MIRIKVCGIRSIEEINELASLNIDYFGCIFAKSTRQVSVDTAKNIVNIIHKNNKKAVGVFVNEEIEKVMKIRDEVKLDIIQLHGDESPKYCKNLGGRIWKAFRIYDELPNITEYSEYIELPLFDAKGESYGGNGLAFNWNILKDIPYQYILAGGLSNSNIKEALIYNPFILDLNSKMEVNNKKNKNLVLEVLELLK